MPLILQKGMIVAAVTHMWNIHSNNTQKHIFFGAFVCTKDPAEVKYDAIIHLPVTMIRGDSIINCCRGVILMLQSTTLL